MTALDSWLKQATRHLSKDSATQVQTEIRAHYESARESAMNSGATADEADRLAMNALGDAKTANCQYRAVLLTSAEASMLREGNWEARAVCSRSWLKWSLLALPVGALTASLVFFFTGAISRGWTLLAGAIGLGFVFGVPFLPVYTLSRARIFRGIRWVVLLAVLGFTLKSSWLLMSGLWPLVWIEWTRISIRRKLPVSMWPKHLYL
jgi:hypothetical protein